MKREPFKPIAQIQFGVSTLSQYAIDLAQLTGNQDDEGFRIAIVTFDCPPDRYEVHSKLFEPKEGGHIRQWFADIEDLGKYSLQKEEGLCMSGGCTHRARWRVRWTDIKRSLDLCDDHKTFAESLESGRKLIQVAPLPSCAN